MTESDEFTPVLRVTLGRADMLEFFNVDLLAATSGFNRALGLRARDVLRSGVFRHFAPRMLMMEQGREGGSLFFVLSGMVRLYAQRGDGFVELKAATPGEVVGEHEVLSGVSVRHMSAVSQGTVDIIELSRGSLLDRGVLPERLTSYLKNVSANRAQLLNEMVASVAIDRG